MAELENVSESETKKTEKSDKSTKKVGKAKKVGFFKGLKSEMGKITWYPKKTTLKNTIWVIIFLVILAAVIGVVDWGFAKIINLLSQLNG